MTSPDAPDCIEIGQANGLRASINRHGAQLWRLIDHDDTDLLWSGDPQVWNGRAPILFPIVGSLADGAYRYQDRRYSLPRHGFARHSRFAVIAEAEDSVLLRLEASADSLAVYPFAFQLDLRFTCAAGALEIAVSVHNPGNDTLPFSFGFHPALRWPLEQGASRADHYLTFGASEPGPINRLDDAGLVLPEPVPTPVVDRRLELRDDLFTADALIFTDIASRCVNYGAQVAGENRGRHLRVDFDNFPLLGVWTKPGAGYICIEPWQGLADPVGFAGDIFAKPGIVALAAAATWHARMVLSPVAPR